MPPDRPAHPGPSPGSGRPGSGPPGTGAGPGPAGPGQGAEQAGSGHEPTAPKRPRLTTRAAVLAVVLCAIALSLAYPVREYIAQRRQIDQLEAQQQAIAARLGTLQAEQQHLRSNAYVEQQAEDRLHMCLPTLTCYVIISKQPPPTPAAPAAAGGTPWYERLWSSVRQADKVPAR
jgi:cell division protein FtsB